jgi:hypothetical protein
MYKILLNTALKYKFTTYNNLKQIPNQLRFHLHTKLMHLLEHTRTNYVIRRHSNVQRNEKLGSSVFLWWWVPKFLQED